MQMSLMAFAPYQEMPGWSKNKRKDNKRKKIPKKEKRNRFYCFTMEVKEKFHSVCDVPCVVSWWSEVRWRNRFKAVIIYKIHHQKLSQPITTIFILDCSFFGKNCILIRGLHCFKALSELWWHWLWTDILLFSRPNLTVKYFMGLQTTVKRRCCCLCNHIKLLLSAFYSFATKMLSMVVTCLLRSKVVASINVAESFKRQKPWDKVN